MAKITRYNGNLEAPASAALGTERTIFGTGSQSDDLTDQFNSFLLRGWGIVGPSDQPTLQEFNAMGFTLGQLHAYLHQMGVAEYNATQEYHIGSIANVAGVLYVSLVDTNVGNAPASSPAQWSPQAGHGMIVLASTQSWSVPLAMRLGFIKPKVTVIAGGGAGSRLALSAGGGGGGGGSSSEVIDLTGVASVSVTVGAGGVTAASGVSGGTGGASSFGAFLSASGGVGGNGSGEGGNGGLGSSGDINLTGNGGGSAAQGVTGSLFMSGHGGGSLLGGGGRSFMRATAIAGISGVHGGGGSGSVLDAVAGSGGPGIVIIEW